ncbi:MAG: polysaccharide deacetylase family protein [Pseudobacteriovorax sp.]|nr:polysaccharide deacetylase family protein [Pseudobacteriovorax sp.]
MYYFATALIISLLFTSCKHRQSHSHLHELSDNTQFASERYTNAWDGVPNKTLTLTFDDGPSNSETIQIAEYLKQHGISATFLVQGSRAFSANGPSMLKQLKDLGHIVGNHTWDHRTPSIDNVTRVDDQIHPYITDGIYLFRAPGGEWYRSLASQFNQNAKLKKYVGPLWWDIGGTAPFADWDCRGKRSVESCANGYYQESQQVGKGIVLFHDTGYGSDATYTLKLVKNLIPRWKSAGFRFIRIDEVPGIKAELLKTGVYKQPTSLPGKVYMASANQGGGEIYFRINSPGSEEIKAWIDRYEPVFIEGSGPIIETNRVLNTGGTRTLTVKAYKDGELYAQDTFNFNVILD